MPEKYFTVGKIVGTHGLRGELKVLPHTDFPETRFQTGSELSLEQAGADKFRTLEVEGTRAHKGLYIVKFKGIDSLTDAEKYRNGVLKVDDSKLAQLDEGEYYFHEIIGCHVFTEDGEELGEIHEILTPGANDVWVVNRKEGKPFLLPVIDDVLIKVETANKQVIIRLMEGLL